MTSRALMLLLFLFYTASALAADTRDWTPLTVSLEDLVAKSRIIVVAEPVVESDEILSPDPCLAVAHTFKVQSVVRNLTNVPTTANTRIRVLPYVHFQMKNRCGKSGYVRNFKQERYFPKKFPTKTETVILFLTVASKGLYFHALDSLESSALLADVMKLAPLRCEELKHHYNEFLETLSEDCGSNEDCAVYDYDSLLGGCGREVFHKHSLPGFTRDFLSLMSKKAETVCTRPSADCEKIHVTPACRENKCINLVRQPDQEMFLAEGTVSHGCAPFDGPALQFKAPIKGEVAYASISIYQEFPTVDQPFEFSWGSILEKLSQSKGAGSSYSAAYCPGKRTCVPAESGKLTLEKFGGDTAPSPGEFTLKFKNGNSVHGKTNFRPAPKQGSVIRCG